MKKPRIKLYEKRSFSEKLSVTFDFMSENSKILLRFLVYLLLPVSILQAMGINSVMNTALSGMLSDISGAGVEDLISFGLWYAVMLIAYFIGSILLTSLVFGLMQVYGKRQERLAGLTFEEFRPTLMRGVRRMTKLILVLTGYAILITIAICLLIAASPVIGGTLAVMAFIAILVIAVPLMLTSPICIFEDVTVNDAIAKAMRLGFRTWGGIFGVTFVLGFICQMVAGACMMPWYIMTIMKGIFVISDNTDGSGIVNSPVYTVVNYLLGVVYVFGTYAATTLILTGVGIQYGHAAEKIDGVSVEHDVDRFEELADNSVDDSRLFEKRDDIDNFENI